MKYPIYIFNALSRPGLDEEYAVHSRTREYTAPLQESVAAYQVPSHTHENPQ